MSQVCIRAARESDTPVILNFITALAEYERLAHEVVSTVESLRTQLFGANPSAEVALAEIDNQPVGFALFFHNFSTFKSKRGLYLEDLFVLPEARGKGAGKALLLHLAKLARERGCARMEWSVLDWNKPSIDFYLSLGAEPMDEWTVYRLTEEKLKALS